jgi:Oxidoreductase family, NAD-binding Rossmann fold
MRLGLVGRGPQAERYLMPKNGGNYITCQVAGRSQYDADKFLSRIDGVIVACHPDGHDFWCSQAFSRGLPVLCEKPLALSLAACERIMEASNGLLLTAHVRLWERCVFRPDHVVVRCDSNSRHNYSAWLDWGPHALSLLTEAGLEPNARDVCLYEAPGDSQIQIGGATPMWLMIRDFVNGVRDDMTKTRAIYRALFAQENHGTT